MASIPLPALHVQTEQQSPLALYAQAQQIRNAQTQQQLASTEVQQRQLQLQDTQATTAAMREWDGKNPDDLPPLVLRHGGSSTAVFGLKNQILDWKTKAATLTKDQLDNLDKTNDIIAGHFEAVRDADDKQKAYGNAIQDLVQKGLAQPGQFPPQYQGDDWLDQQEKAHMGQKAIVEQAQKNKEIQQKQQDLELRRQEFESTMPGGAKFPPTLAGQEAQEKLNVESTPQAIQLAGRKAAGEEVAKQNALAVPLDQLTNTTMAGRKYINRDDLPKESAGVMEQQAAARGIRVVDKDTAGTLSDIDDAKANMNTMLNLVKGKLAASPAERIYKGPENKLEAAMQTDPTLASMGTFRNAAIKTMRAVAGSKGLRINQYEVQLAIDNDIPKMTDTWEVANQKINTLQKFLDNAENTHLTLNRGAGANATSATGSSSNGTAQTGPMTADEFKKRHNIP